MKDHQQVEEPHQQAVGHAIDLLHELEHAIEGQKEDARVNGDVDAG